MEYRGMEYTVVQTIENGWRWSVKVTPKEKSENPRIARRRSFGLNNSSMV
jgi:hypothetical protein